MHHNSLMRIFIRPQTVPFGHNRNICWKLPYSRRRSYSTLRRLPHRSPLHNALAGGPQIVVDGFVSGTKCSVMGSRNWVYLQFEFWIAPYLSSLAFRRSPTTLNIQSSWCGLTKIQLSMVNNIKRTASIRYGKYQVKNMWFRKKAHIQLCHSKVMRSEQFSQE